MRQYTEYRVYLTGLYVPDIQQQYHSVIQEELCKCCQTKLIAMNMLILTEWDVDALHDGANKGRLAYIEGCPIPFIP